MNNKPRTLKQLAALAQGRAKRQANILARYAMEAQSRYTKTKEFTEDFNAQKYINRLVYSSKEEGITVKQAHTALMHTFPYTNKEDNYRYQIFQHVDWNELKERVAEATGARYTTVRKQDSARFGQVRVAGWTKELIESQFTDAGDNIHLMAAFENEETGQTSVIKLRIIEGTGSDDPNFVEIS